MEIMLHRVHSVASSQHCFRSDAIRAASRVWCLVVWLRKRRGLPTCRSRGLELLTRNPIFQCIGIMWCHIVLICWSQWWSSSSKACRFISAEHAIQLPRISMSDLFGDWTVSDRYQCRNAISPCLYVPLVLQKTSGHAVLSIWWWEVESLKSAHFAVQDGFCTWGDAVQWSSHASMTWIWCWGHWTKKYSTVLSS